MRIILVGAGEVGYSLAQSLVEDGHDVVVVERDEERASKVENELDVMVVRGNGARPQVLDRAGVSLGKAADVLIACTDHDEVNILACWIARRAGVQRVISRVRSMEFTDTKAWAKDLGIDAMISPERSVARQIEALLAVSSAVEAADLGGGKAGIYAFRVAEGAPLAGIQLKVLTNRMPNLKTMMVYIKRDGQGIVPSGESWVQPGDLCYMVALKEHVWDVEQAFQLKKSVSLRRVVIAGGGKTGFQVARRLEARPGQRVDIRLIEKDREKCEKLAEELKNTVVLHGDAADENLLRAEGIDRANGFVSTTANDEVNILLAVLAKAMGAKKSIALVRRKSFASLDRYISLDAVVNPTEALASAILGLVRYPSAEGGLATISKIGAEMLEVEIASGSPSEGRHVSELGLSPGATLALGIRGPEVFVPRGDTVIRSGDRYLLFSTAEKMSQAVQILGVR